MSPRQHLFDLLRSCPSESFQITPRIDSQRNLQRTFAPELPFLLKQYTFPRYRQMLRGNWMHWHDYFELIIPLEGHGEFRVGGETARFGPGDLLVVDNLKLHGMSRLSGQHRSLVIFFPMEAVAPPGCSTGDHAFLAPLCARPEDVPPVMTGGAAVAEKVHTAIASLAEAYFGLGPASDRYVLCKLHLLSILSGLREHFGVRDSFDAELQQRQRRHHRLQRVFAYLAEHLGESLAQPEIAAVAGMSTSRFREFFKYTTGLTFVDYVRDLRLTRAAQMLRESAESVAQTAAACGFSDQSYLTRCFRQRYGVAPLEYRRGERVEDACGNRALAGSRR